MRSALLTLVMVCSACATAPQPVTKLPAEEVFGQAPPPELPSAMPAHVWVRQFARPADCEAAARATRAEDGHAAWIRLKACVARGGFNLLYNLAEYWGDDLRNRPDAGSVLAQVLAVRGARLDADLQFLQERRIPLFELSAALRQPNAFKGRYLVVAARVGDVREEHGRTEMVLSEVTAQTEVQHVWTGPRAATQTSANNTGNGAWGFPGTHGPVFPGSGRGTLDSRALSQSGTLETRAVDSFADTGKEIVLRVTKADPFLGSDRPFVFLVRFDGTRVSDDAQTDDASGDQLRTPVVTLISYHDVNSQYAF